MNHLHIWQDRPTLSPAEVERRSKTVKVPRKTVTHLLREMVGRLNNREFAELLEKVKRINPRS